MSKPEPINTTEKREDRAKQTAEVFSPPRLVRKMLDKLPKEVWKKGKTFIDPACGNGNFLIAVLTRKIERGHKPLEALKTIYGVDIMKDNIQECRLRLLKLISIYGEEITEAHVQAVFMNIIYINANKHKGGSLDYDFAFDNRQSKQNLQRWLTDIQNGKLQEVTLPVEETKIYPPEGCCFPDDEDEEKDKQDAA